MERNRLMGGGATTRAAQGHEQSAMASGAMRVRWALMPLVALVAGCSASVTAPRSDEEKIVLVTLQLLAQPGKELCVDADTTGRPLSVFRTMASNPPPGLKPLAWYVPAALRPTKAVTNADLYRGARSQTKIHIDQPANATAMLNRAAQVQLDQAAWALSLRLADEGVKITRAWPVAGLKPRWWLRNRISFHCTPNYRFTNPIVVRNVGFVTVNADHWGTTYAFARRGGAWVAVGQWSNWLY